MSIWLGHEVPRIWPKEIKPVNLKGNQPSTVIGKTDAEADAPIFWLPGVKSQLTGKEPEAGDVLNILEVLASAIN